MTKAGVAIIGAGRMGQIHGLNAACNPVLKVKYVVDPRPDAAKSLAARVGARVGSLNEVLDDTDVRGVLICSSTNEHLPNALAAVEAGKAVFCEKPIDLDIAKVRKAQPRFDRARFQLGFNRRFDPHFRQLHEQIAAGIVGPLETLHVVNHDPAAPPKGFIPTSGGLFKDFTIHDLDLARWLLGEEPVEVYSVASCLVDPEIGRLGDVDTARTFLKTDTGRMCVISNTRRSGYGYDQRVEAFGARGMACAQNVTGDTIHVLTETSIAGAPIQPDFGTRYQQSYKAEIDDFARVLLDDAPLAVDYADGVAALVLAEACEASFRNGRMVSVDPNSYLSTSKRV